MQVTYLTRKEANVIAIQAISLKKKNECIQGSYDFGLNGRYVGSVDAVSEAHADTVMRQHGLARGPMQGHRLEAGTYTVVRGR